MRMKKAITVQAAPRESSTTPVSCSSSYGFCIFSSDISLELEIQERVEALAEHDRQTEGEQQQAGNRFGQG